MPERATPVVRWSRALVVASVAFGLGLVAHLAAGGLVPGPLGLAVLFALATAGCAALLGRPASTVRITALVVAGQTAIHAALTAAAGHAGDPVRHATALPAPPVVPPVVPGADRRGSLHDAYERASLARGGTADQLVVPDWVQHLVDDLSGPHAVMALAHLVAAALVGLWLASGERALWALIRLSRSALGATVRGLVAALGVVPAPLGRPLTTPRGGEHARHRLRSYLLASTHARRGPPALLAA